MSALPKPLPAADVPGFAYYTPSRIAAAANKATAPVNPALAALDQMFAYWSRG